MKPATDALTINKVRVPQFIYGTAWKEDRTHSLTLEALNNGFTGIDTANQRKHYHEAEVGRAIQSFLGSNDRQRQDLFLQSKFTFAPGQDHRLPYDPGADYATQVQQSFNSSLEHLQTDYLDSYMLHGPSQGEGLGAVDFEVWQAMEALYRSGKVKLLGISNITLEQLEYLNHHVAIKPAFVQNRCYAVTGWDQETRALCKRHGIYYQGFSLLTANSQLFETPGYKAIEQRTGLSGPQIVFQTALKLGMIVLTGTSSPQHMQQDLDCGSVELTDDEVTVIETALMI